MEMEIEMQHPIINPSSSSFTLHHPNPFLGEGHCSLKLPSLSITTFTHTVPVAYSLHSSRVLCEGASSSGIKLSHHVTAYLNPSE